MKKLMSAVFILFSSLLLGGCVELLAFIENNALPSCGSDVAGTLREDLGGVIIINSGGRCVVAALSDASASAAWTAGGSDSPALGTSCNDVTGDIPGYTPENCIGSRVQTESIANATGNHPAAQACIDSSLGDFSDWYLPGLYELNQIYANKSTLNASGFFWSSSEVESNPENGAWAQGFADGDQGFVNKGYGLQVRCVREI